MLKKQFVVQATFPHLKVKDAVQQARVAATGFALAAKAGLKEILARPGVKGKRHRHIQLVITLCPHASAEEDAGAAPVSAGHEAQA